MPSIRARMFHLNLKVFFRLLMPPNLPLEAYRKASSQPLFEPMPRDIRWEPRQINRIPGEWITPPTTAKGRLLLYLHGGGYIVRTPHVHRVLAGRLARLTECVAFVVDYRLAPEHPFPAALEDATAAYLGLLADGYSPEQIWVAGDSAGGGLTMALLLHLREKGIALPAAACLISALLDCTLSDDQLPELQKRDPYLRLSDLQMMARHYCADESPRHPLISPVFADLDGLPPLLIFAGSDEVLLNDSSRLAANAGRVGVTVEFKVWDGMVHAFPLFARFVPEGHQAIHEISVFVQRHLP